jgi:hypothetical protein
MSPAFFIRQQKSQGPNFFRAAKKVTAMSVDTDKGIDDLPPDADTLRDTTHMPFSGGKILFILYFIDRSSTSLICKIIILYCKLSLSGQDLMCYSS